MRDSFHLEARANQFARLADQALTAVERRGFVELAERYRRMAEEQPPAETSDKSGAPAS
jgi:hypothetical protein